MGASSDHRRSPALCDGHTWEATRRNTPNTSSPIQLQKGFNEQEYTKSGVQPLVTSAGWFPDIDLTHRCQQLVGGGP